MHDPLLEDPRWLALAFHEVRRMLRADGQMAQSERSFLGHLPLSRSAVKAGLVAEDTQLTAAGTKALGDALLTAQQALNHTQKLRLITLLYQAAMSDGVYRPEEAEVMIRVAALLGLSEVDIQGHLGNIADAESIDLPPPEDTL